jgi:septal ring factor EnvC (AmiA/AmiB activator)
VTAAAIRPTGSTSAIPAVAPEDTTATGPELQQSRSEIAALEQQLASARAEVQLRLQQDLNDEVAAIRLLLAQEQARRDEQSAASQEDRARKEAAVNTLFTAQARLATGDRYVLNVIDDASPALPAPAQSAAERARVAIRSEDLYNARYWLAIAIAETQVVLAGH